MPGTIEDILEYLKKQFDKEDIIYVANLGDYKTIVLSIKPIVNVGIDWME